MPAHRAHDVRLHRHRCDVIIRGTFADTSEFDLGVPFAYDDPVRDSQIFIDDIIVDSDDLAALDPAIRMAFQRLRDRFSVKNLRAALKAAEARQSLLWAKRLLVYLVCSGDEEARRRYASIIALKISGGIHGFDSWMCAATCWGLLTSSQRSMPDYNAAGQRAFAQMRAAKESIDVREDAARVHDDVDAEEHAEFMQAVAEDRAEFYRPRTSLLPRRDKPAEGVIVIRKPPDSGTAHGREVARRFQDIYGKRLALVKRPDVVSVRSTLISEFPWIHEGTDTLTRDLSGTEHVRFHPTILVGEKGAAKNSFVQRLLQLCGLAYEVVPLGGTSDGSPAGTSQQWSSARANNGLQLMHKAKSATVALVFDEMEKAKSSHNGSAMDALLAMMEPTTSRIYRDPALETEVDLSYVSFFATANSLDQIPGPLRDRMRIIRIPSPGWQHVGTITRRLLDEIARQRGEPPAAYASLAPDELEQIKAVWNGGSLRALRKVLVATLAAREATARRN